MGVALFGYILRLALVTVAVLAISRPVLVLVRSRSCATIVLTHLGLLIWETRYVSATLAYPGLKPRLSGAPAGEQKGS